MFLLDTNVLSGLMKVPPDEHIRRWIVGKSASDLCTAAICQAEVLAGIAALDPGRQRASLEAAALRVFERDFADRILPFDSRAALSYATLYAERRRTGRNQAFADLMISAIAYAHGARIVTGDEGFGGWGVTLINPWREP